MLTCVPRIGNRKEDGAASSDMDLVARGVACAPRPRNPFRIALPAHPYRTGKCMVARKSFQGRRGRAQLCKRSCSNKHTREEPGKTGAPCVKVPGSSRVPHRLWLVVYHSTCRPLSSSPPREQLCNRSCSNKHTHTIAIDQNGTRIVTLSPKS